MKKTKLLFTATMCAMLLVTGCGKSKAKDYSKYVKLGEYKGIEVTLKSTDVTNKEVNEKIDSTLKASATKEDVKGRAIKKGDIANIDYVGKIDGKEFENGSDKAFDLTIGSGQFIEGFEEQLIGHNAGETVEVNVTFPDNYSQNEELSGKPATFTVTINSIKEEVVPELTDKWVKEKTNKAQKTVEEYKEAVRTEIETKKIEEAATQKTADVLSGIIENSEITGYPQDELDAYVEDMKAYYTSYASSMGTDLDTLLTSFFGMTQESFNDEANKLAKETVARQMICKLIAEKENMTVTDDEYKKGLEQYAAQYSNTNEQYTADEFEKQYGKDVVKENILLEKVLTFITDNAVVKK